jgi:hypothetical protein
MSGSFQECALSLRTTALLATSDPAIGSLECQLSPPPSETGQAKDGPVTVVGKPLNDGPFSMNDESEMAAMLAQADVAIAVNA